MKHTKISREGRINGEIIDISRYMRQIIILKLDINKYTLKISFKKESGKK